MVINKTIFIFFFSLILLYLGKFILLPLSISLFIYLVIKSLSNKFLIYFNNFFKIKLSEILALIIVFLILFSFLYFFWIILEFNITGVKQKSVLYQNNLDEILNLFSNTIIKKIIPLNDVFNDLNFMNIFSKTLNSLSNLAGSFSFIIILLIFFMIEEKYFVRKLKLIVNNKNMQIIKKINYDIFYYFQIKFFTSFLTGFSTFIVLYFLQNDLAPTFGLLSFILNFIPLIGSLVSILLPFIFSGIQFLSFYEPILTLITLIIIQIFIGNFLEPKMMGNTLNISPLVMILFLSLMGKLWGVAGMFLSVPFLVVILIILRRINSTKKIAIFLSEKGNN